MLTRASVSEVERDMLLIRCKTPGCVQVLCHYTNEARTELEIDVARARIDSDGRPVVVCPACRTRNRLPAKARAP